MAAKDAGRAFIGSFTSEGGRGIVTAAVDRETGALTVLAATDAVADPSFLALARGGAVLYAVSETADGAAAAFAVAGGRAELLGVPVPVRGSAPTHLALVGRHLLTANYGSGSITVLPVRPDGRLGEAVSVLPHKGAGPDPERRRGPHAHQVVTDPSGRWVLGVDLGTDSVHVFVLDTASGVPRPHGVTALRPGTGPRHMAFHPDGCHAYVLCEFEPTLTACRWDAQAGLLEPLGETPVLPEGTEVTGHPSEVVVSQDGRFLWAAVRGSDSIAVLALDGVGSVDEPVLVTTVDCGGHWPRDLALDPSGRRLYAANERSGDVTWFAIDERTGIPRRAGSIEAPAASCVVFA
ncbi:lactonase family protein [Streptomyces sp. NPDC051219]|uniref:lactonase family protein n=1 Tax=Streptomyces sp. NPDC051219 TaxID=3155283 RepID=UPI00343BDEB6